MTPAHCRETEESDLHLILFTFAILQAINTKYQIPNFNVNDPKSLPDPDFNLIGNYGHAEKAARLRSQAYRQSCFNYLAY